MRTRIFTLSHASLVHAPHWLALVLVPKGIPSVTYVSLSHHLTTALHRALREGMWSRCNPIYLNSLCYVLRNKVGFSEEYANILFNQAA